MLNMSEDAASVLSDAIHYAKEKGWFFPKTQSATQTSVVVYVE